MRAQNNPGLKSTHPALRDALHHARTRARADNFCDDEAVSCDGAARGVDETQRLDKLFTCPANLMLFRPETLEKWLFRSLDGARAATHHTARPRRTKVVPARHKEIPTAGAASYYVIADMLHFSSEEKKRIGKTQAQAWFFDNSAGRCGWYCYIPARRVAFI